MIRRILILGAISLAATHATAVAQTRNQIVQDFYNVAAPDGADPWVIRGDDGWYYLCYSTGGKVAIRRSRTISAIGGGESRVIWTPPAEGPYSKEIWAPELHRVRGAWYVYVAADDGDNANHRMVALENPSPDPFEGEFVFKGKVADPDSDKWAIDGTVLELPAEDAGSESRLYFVWSGWEGDVNVDQRTYIAPMSDPTTISGPRVELSRPTFNWEKAAGPPTINEGPQFLIRDGRVFLVYSAAGSWSDYYCLGMLTLKQNADPLEPSSWIKSDRPVFQGANGVVSPGHCSFTTSPDGTEDWIVFHAAKRPGAGWSRSVRAQPFQWNVDGSPDFGEPIGPDRLIPIPAGEPARLRLEAEAAHLDGAARVVPDEASSGGSKIVGLEGEGASATFTATVDEDGTYVVAVRYRSVAGPRERADQHVEVDGRPAGTIAYPDSGRDQWSSSFARLPLQAGANRITLRPGRNQVEVDALDVVLAK